MRIKKGIICSTKMTGTVTVTVHRLVFHPVYKKRYRKSKKFLCDPNGLDLYLGDEVMIAECKPISKRKCFRVTEIVKAAPRVDALVEEAAIEQVIHRQKKGADEDSKMQKKRKKGAKGTDDTDETSASSVHVVPSAS